MAQLVKRLTDAGMTSFMFKPFVFCIYFAVHLITSFMGLFVDLFPFQISFQLPRGKALFFL